MNLGLELIELEILVLRDAVRVEVGPLAVVRRQHGESKSHFHEILVDTAVVVQA